MRGRRRRGLAVQSAVSRGTSTVRPVPDLPPSLSLSASQPSPVPPSPHHGGGRGRGEGEGGGEGGCAVRPPSSLPTPFSLSPPSPVHCSFSWPLPSRLVSSEYRLWPLSCAPSVLSFYLFVFSTPPPYSLLSLSLSLSVSSSPSSLEECRSSEAAKRLLSPFTAPPSPPPLRLSRPPSSLLSVLLPSPSLSSPVSVDLPFLPLLLPVVCSAPPLLLRPPQSPFPSLVALSSLLLSSVA